MSIYNNFHWFSLFFLGFFFGFLRLSSQEEIRRFSFGLDADTFTEVDVCEKTFSFKISTEIRPSSQWTSHSSVYRRASLAVMTPCKLTFFSLFFFVIINFLFNFNFFLIFKIWSFFPLNTIFFFCYYQF